MSTKPQSQMFKKQLQENTNKYGIFDVKYIEDRVYKVKDMAEKSDIGKS